MKKGDTLWYARCLVGLFDMCELFIRTIDEDFFVGVDKKDKRAYLLSYDDIGKYVFKNRADALEVLKIEESKYAEE